MEIKVLLCNCKGLCDSFKAADMNTLPFDIESDARPLPDAICHCL